MVVEGAEGEEEAKGWRMYHQNFCILQKRRRSKKKIAKEKRRGRNAHPCRLQISPTTSEEAVKLVPVFHSRKWFRHYHELVKLDGNDPRPQQ